MMLLKMTVQVTISDESDSDADIRGRAVAGAAVLPTDLPPTSPAADVCSLRDPSTTVRGVPCTFR